MAVRSTLVYFLVLLFVKATLLATPTCKKINDCACTPTDTSETGIINFFPLISATGAKPMYMVNGTSQQTKLMYEFSYNPCMGFSINSTSSTDPCTTDLLCQKDIKYSFIYDIGAVGHTQFAYVNNVLFAYYYSNSTNNRTSEVRLICDENETHGKFVFIAEPRVLYYQFNFTSICACPGKCPNKTMIPDKWVKTDSCSYRHTSSGRVINLQGLDTPLKVAIDEYTTYYYNPCNGLKLESLDDECKDVAVCQQDMSTSSPTYHGIGSKEPKVTEEDGDIVLHYSAVNGGELQSFDVKLICDQSADDPTFTVLGDKAATLRSKYACPQ